MKRQFLFIFLFLTVSIIYSQVKTFEGEINYNIKTCYEEDGPKERNYNYLISGKKFRIENLGDSSFTIIDPKKAVYYFTTDEKVKSYKALTKEDMNKDKYAQDNRKTKTLRLQNGLSNETQEIMGYLCKKISYQVRGLSDDEYYYCELWVITEKNISMPIENFDYSMRIIDECYENGMIPMLVTVKLDDDKEVERYEVVKIEEKKIKSSTFNFPNGYKKSE